MFQRDLLFFILEVYIVSCSHVKYLYYLINYFYEQKYILY